MAQTGVDESYECSLFKENPTLRKQMEDQLSRVDKWKWKLNQAVSYGRTAGSYSRPLKNVDPSLFFKFFKLG